MKIGEIIQILESVAPLSTQESYDNSGLIVGDKSTEITGTLISLDCTEDIVDEAIEKGCNLIISHHPIVFKGLKKFNGKNYVERVVIKAIQNGIALYAIHTNLDNYQLGVNKMIGSKLGIEQTRILSAKENQLEKIVTYVPTEHLLQVQNALFNAGAGNIGDYSDCSFSSEGTGTYKGNEDSNPAYGEKGKRHYEAEHKLEVLVEKNKTHSAIQALLSAHPYEEVAYDVLILNNKHPYLGSGMIGELDEAVPVVEFLERLKKQFNCGVIRHTELCKTTIKKVAWCGGSGSFLLSAAKSQNADIFITADFKYHEFFDAENQIIIADIGHYESEQFTIELIRDIITKKIPTFAPCLTEHNTNPVKYF